MKYFLFLAAALCVGVCLNTSAQDSIVTSDGQQIRARVLKIKWKDVQYKVYDDPEFTTYTLKEKEIKTIKTEKGKKYLFNHKLPRAYIGLSIEACIPVGAFGRTDYEKKEPGFAMTGLGGNLLAGFYITKRIGVHFRIGASGNRQDVDAYKKIYADPSDPYEILKVNYDDSRAKQYYNNWSFQTFLLGPMYSFKPAQWLTVDARLSFGITGVQKPALRIYANDSLPMQMTIIKYSIDNEKAPSKTFNVYGGGLTFRISPVRRIGFLIGVDYLHTGGKIHFKETIWTAAMAQSGQSPQTMDVNRTFNIDQIKVSLGIAYQFKRKNR